jgi:probable F420-dependent oxidoreductase
VSGSDEVVIGLRMPAPVGDDPGATMAGVARTAEEHGVESLWTVEHVIVAKGYAPEYPYSADGKIPGGGMGAMPDPLETLAYVGGATRTIRLGTSVVVGPLHSAAVMAKRAATLQLLSGGRFLLGLGIGWQREEYAAVGAPFDHRGARLDEMIGAMRALWADSPASYDGTYVNFRDVFCEPRPPGGSVPVVIGGSSEAAAGRAGRLGQGWLPFVVSAEEFAAGARVVRATAAAAGRDPAQVELTAWPGSFDPDSEDDVDAVAPYVAAGARRLFIRPPAISGLPSDVERVAERIANYKQRVLARL